MEQNEYKELADHMVKRFVNKSNVDWTGPGHQIVEDCNLWGTGSVSKLQKEIYKTARIASEKKTEYIDSRGKSVIFVVIDKGKQYHRCATGGWRNCNLYKLVEAK